MGRRPTTRITTPGAGSPSSGDLAPGRVYRERRIVIGEVAASAEPLLLRTLLGSCVAVCLRDPVSRVGGMNHILVPGACPLDQLPSRCGVGAMESLIDEIVRVGGDRRNLVAKAFGAANVVPSLQVPTIGELNARFVRDFLAAAGIPLVAQRLGGTHAVQVHFRTDTGKAIVHSVDGSRLPAILLAEDDFIARASARQPAPGEAAPF